MFIRLLGFFVLAFGALALFSTATGTHPDPFIKWFAVVLSAAIALLGWAMVRRKKAVRTTGDMVDPPTAPRATMSDALATSEKASEDPGPLSEVFSPARSVDLGSPPTSVVPAATFKELKKRNCFFEDVKHLVGIPHQEAKSRFNILLLDEGIVPAETKTNSEVYRVLWNLLEGVETHDSRSAQDQAAGNSLMTGAIGSGKIGLGGLLAVDLMNEMMSRHPLILRYRTHPRDPMSSAIAFDTFDNERIATAILAKRSSLLAAGKISFD